MKHFLVGSLVVTLALVASPDSAVAWTSMHNCSNGSPIAWAPGNPNTRWQLSSTYVSGDLTNTQVDAAVNGAFNEWSVPGCTELNVLQGGDSSGSPLDNNNDDDIVGFMESSWPATMGGSSTLAVTIPSWYQEPHCEFIENADMVINGVDHYWVIGNPANWNQADLQSVIAHEAGHWMGFDHNNYAGSTLTSSYSGGISERTLTCSDTEGVCSVYPSSGNACTADRYCDCGVGCNGGYCGGTPTGDDDDDDDATAGDDDDDDDDTEGGDITGPCTGSSETFYETEPNDWSNEDDVDWYQAAGGDTSLVGSLTCGNNGQSYTEDTDWFVIDFPCTDAARFTLDWKTDSDLDFYVYGSSGDPLAESQTAEREGPVYAEADASGRLYVAVMCWEGDTATYEFLFDWFPYQGTTGGGDDDDTGSGDDDDDTGSGGDDDDTGSGDDDDDTGSSGDDDDDETLPERRGCSCYDSAEPGTFALRGLTSLDASLVFSGLLLFSLRRRRNSPLH